MSDQNKILDEAKKIINGERQGTYGKAEDNFKVIAGFWSTYLGKEVSPVDVANMMILMKVARNSSGVYKDDNWIDICGYAALGGDIQGKNDKTVEGFILSNANTDTWLCPCKNGEKVRMEKCYDKRR
jgi:hypothetical protein